MKRFSGKAVHQGIAMGPVWVIRKKKQRVKSFRILDPESEEKRLEKAVETSLAQLEELYQKALKETGKVPAGLKKKIDNISYQYEMQVLYSMALEVMEKKDLQKFGKQVDAFLETYGE